MGISVFFLPQFLSSPLQAHKTTFHSQSPAQCNFAINTAFARCNDLPDQLCRGLCRLPVLKSWIRSFLHFLLSDKMQKLFKELFHSWRIIPLGCILRYGIVGLQVMYICVTLERELSPGFAQSLQTAGAWEAEREQE